MKTIKLCSICIVVAVFPGFVALSQPLFADPATANSALVSAPVATTSSAPTPAPNPAEALYAALAAAVNGAKGVAYTSTVTIVRPNDSGKPTAADTFGIDAHLAPPDRYRLEITRKGKSAATITTTDTGGIVSNNFSKKYAQFESPDTVTGFIVGFGRASQGMVSDNTAMAVSSLQNIVKDHPFDMTDDIPSGQISSTIASGSLNGRPLTKLIQVVVQGANTFTLRLYIDKATLTPIRFEQEYVGNGLDIYPYREDFTSWRYVAQPLSKQTFAWAPPAHSKLYTAPRDPHLPIPLAAGAKAPDFIATDSDGKPVRLSNYAGKVVVVDFWATWCVPCQLSLPVTNKLAGEYGGKVTFLGICSWDAKDAFLAWLKDHQDWNINFAFDPSGQDQDKSIAQSEYLVSSIPTQYIIGADGIIQSSVDYADPSDRHLRKLLDKALTAPTK